jgi:hypothetical protein
MHRKSLAMGIVFVLGGMAPCALTAQASMNLTFHPQVGTFVRWIYDTRGEYVYRDFPLIIDSTTAEVVARVGLTRRIVEHLGEAYLAGLTVDSAKAQYRITGRDWRPLVRDSGSTSADYLVDQQHAISPVEREGGPPSLDRVLGVAGAIQVSLPPQPILEGDRWEAQVVYPFTTETPGDSSVTITVTLSGPASATLDSTVVRQSDTLAYVSVNGAFQPSTVQSIHPINNAPTNVEFWGSHASSMVWSTGWQTWVSGATTVRIHERIEAPVGTDAKDARVQADLSTRFRLIP